ncbi:MAG: hypothetical protein ACLGIA_05840 [Actinomycetes bacterium]
MLWFGIWVVLVLGALAVLATVLYDLFRKGVTLAQEMGSAAELLSRAGEQVERLQRAEAERTPAVFQDPVELRRRQRRSRRRRSRGLRMRTTRAGG